MKRFWEWIRKARRDGPMLRRGFDARRLRDRVAGLSPEDPLWPALMELLDAYCITELGPATAGGLDDAEAHRLRGRVGMLLDLRRELQELWREAHPEDLRK